MGELSPVDWTQTGIIAGLVLAILWTGLKRKWLFYWVHDAIVRGLVKELEKRERELEEWKGLALSQAGIVQEAVDRATRLVYRAAGGDPGRLDDEERPT